MDDMELLAQVRWSPAAKVSALFCDYKIKHGFMGIGDAPPPNRQHARQVHGVVVVDTDCQRTQTQTTRRIEADAVLTRHPGEVVAVKTADCLPILIVNKTKTVAIAIHAGWRGLTSGIISHAVAAITDDQVLPQHLIAVVGPAIAREHFEVGSEVVEAILAPLSGITRSQALLALAKGSQDRWHVDLHVAAAFALAQTGILPTHIEVIQACTKTDTRWHSFRREGNAMGSNWSWVEL